MCLKEEIEDILKNHWGGNTGAVAFGGNTGAVAFGICVTVFNYVAIRKSRDQIICDLEKEIGKKA